MHHIRNFYVNMHKACWFRAAADYIPFILIQVLTVASCTERINIKTDDAPPRLVIYGYITSDTTQHSIRITRSAGYFSTGSPEGVSGATVTISTDSDYTVDENMIPLFENDTIPGLYQTADDVYGEEGKTYTLDVHLDGRHYQASAYLQHIHQIDSIGLRTLEIFGKTVGVLLYAMNFGEDNYYSIFVAVNDSVVNNTINRFFVIDDGMFKGQTYIDGIPCYFLNQDPEAEYRNEILHTGDKVTLNINAIPKEYATFISNVQSEIRASIPIFGGPPANVPSNINCIQQEVDVAVSGFFTAFPRRYAYTWVKEEFKFK